MTYIVIEGVVGVGKTALTKLLGERLHVTTFFENFEENPFLTCLTLSTTARELYVCLSPES